MFLERKEYLATFLRTIICCTVNVSRRFCLKMSLLLVAFERLYSQSPWCQWALCKRRRQ
jgi:hypothetical protein